jgi:hypothetical protein
MQNAGNRLFFFQFQHPKSDRKIDAPHLTCPPILFFTKTEPTVL